MTARVMAATAALMILCAMADRAHADQVAGPAAVRLHDDTVSAWMSDVGAGASGDSESTLLANRGKTLRRGVRRVNSAASTKGSGAQPVSIGRSIRSLWPAAAVLALIGAAALAARRWLPQARGMGRSSAIKVLARHALSNKQCLYLVRLGRGVVLIGATPDRLQPIAQIVDPDEASAIITAIERGRSGSFTASLEHFAARDAAEFDPSANQPAGPRRRLESAGPNVRGLVQRVQQVSAMAPAGPM
jgi:flagellar biogenesis protein FliO